MREIEFRIYDKELEKMVYFDDEDYDYRPPLTFRLDQVFRKDSQYNDYEDFEWNDISSKVEIMQYTGLKDENGKKIFEGDIVKDEYCIYEVVYDGNGYYVKVVKLLKACGTEEGLLYDLSDYKDLEIIGNIWDNPDLLKEEL